MNQKRMLQTLLELCAQPSISASAGERAFSLVLREILLRNPYFKMNPNQIWIFPTGANEADGSWLLALQRAERPTKRTILLMSHFDVVGVDEYGSFANLAFQPEEYTAFLKSGAVSLPDEAAEDLASGNYLFGRGTCDMKWGIAAGLELLEYFAAHPDEQKANLLLLSVPDEERNSEGMLAAVRRLAAWRDEQGLELAHCIVSEPDISPEGLSEVKKLHVGAAGKLMPSFYCVGRETHAGEPFAGLNANLLASAVTMEMELSPEFIDLGNGTSSPAPVCLKQGDTKDGYSVQTPCAAYCYFNAITIETTPEQMLEKMRAAAERAFAGALERVAEKHRAAEEKLAAKLPRVQFSPKVLTYAELYRLCAEARGTEFTAHMAEFLKNAPAERDLRTLTIDAVREAHSFCPDRSPMIILFFCPPFYPHTGKSDWESETVHAVRALCGEAAEEGDILEADPCFKGLTDMSYLALRGGVDVESLAAGFPVWGERYSLPLAEIRALDVPFVNFGPLGKDAHKYTERVDLAYSFGKAPKLLLRLVKLLSEDGK